MADNTAIEWTDATWNPIGGCSIKSPGCAPCYAQQLAGTRLAKHALYAGTTTLVKGKPVFNGRLTAAADDHKVWMWPLKWKGAKEPKLGAGMPSTIFVGDMSDLFHEKRDRDDIDMVISPIVLSEHIGQLLTKRPDVMRLYFEGLAHGGSWLERIQHPQRRGTPAIEMMTKTFEQVFRHHLWLGFSAERQKEFDERWAELRPLAERRWTIFVSIEPMIGPVVLPEDFLALGRRAQVICGGMSGKDADRPMMHPDLPRALRDQCKAAGVAFFFKQWGEWEPREQWSGHQGGGRFETMCAILPDGSQVPHDVVPQDVGGQRFALVGKKKAGRLLDGVEHNEFPEVA